MVPHKGRLSYKQYIKSKPTKWGIKLWVLSESITGYIYKFQVYLGKEAQQAEKHLARCVVKDLTVDLGGLNHHLYMDNFYCDPHLFNQLMVSNIHCCGTVKANRKGFPQDIVISKQQERHLERGHYQWRMNEQLLAMSWFDKRSVYLLSTIHPPKNEDGSLPTTQRRTRNGEQIDVPCPPAHSDYQAYMGGVDLSDQLIKNFSVIRKSKKAWKKLFGYGLEVSLLDSFIIMKQTTRSSKDLLSTDWI